MANENIQIKISVDGAQAGTALDAVKTKVDALQVSANSANAALKTTANGGVSQMNQALGQLGYGLGDASMFMVNFRMGMMSIGNNIPIVVNGLMNAKKAAEESGSSFKSVLASSLAGPGGVMVAINLAIMATQVFSTVLEKSGKQAKETANAYEEAAKAVLTFKGASDTKVNVGDSEYKASEAMLWEIAQKIAYKDKSIQRQKIIGNVGLGAAAWGPKTDTEITQEAYENLKASKYAQTKFNDLQYEFDRYKELRNQMKKEYEDDLRKTELQSRAIKLGGKLDVKPAKEAKEPKVKPEKEAKDETEKINKEMWSNVSHESELYYNHQMELIEADRQKWLDAGGDKAVIENAYLNRLNELNDAYYKDDFKNWDDAEKAKVKAAEDALKKIADAEDLKLKSKEANLRTQTAGFSLKGNDLSAQAEKDQIDSVRDKEAQYGLDIDKRVKDGLITEKFAAGQKVRIQGEAEAKITEIQQVQQQSRLMAVSATLGMMAGVFGNHTAAYKVLASAQVVLDTYTGAQSAFRSMAAIPVVGPTLGAMAATAATAMGIKNLAKINSTKVSAYAKGGYIDSPTYGLIGEAGPEVVAPLGDFQSYSVGIAAAAVQRMQLSITSNVALTAQNDMLKRNLEAINNWNQNLNWEIGHDKIYYSNKNYIDQSKRRAL